MKMKRIICAALAAVLAAGLFCGCQAKEKVVINSAEDLAGKKIGVQNGTTGETYVLENVDTPQDNVLSYKSGMDAALDLKNGAIDAVVLDELPAKAIVAQNSDLEILPIILTTEEYAIAVRKGDTALVESINKTIAAMKENGEYEALVNAFMPADGNIVIPENIETSGAVIKMGTNAAFKPFEYVEGTEIVGFDITMSQYIARDYKKQLEVVDMNFDSLISALQAGTIDFIAAGMTANDERRKSVDFSDSYFSSSQVIIVRK